MELEEHAASKRSPEVVLGPPTLEGRACPRTRLPDAKHVVPHFIAIVSGNAIARSLAITYFCASIGNIDF